MIQRSNELRVRRPGESAIAARDDREMLGSTPQTIWRLHTNTSRRKLGAKEGAAHCIAAPGPE